jgi:hypothetical protein
MKVDKTAECILQEKNINQSPVLGAFSRHYALSGKRRVV